MGRKNIEGGSVSMHVVVRNRFWRQVAKREFLVPGGKKNVLRHGGSLARKYHRATILPFFISQL